MTEGKKMYLTEFIPSGLEKDATGEVDNVA